MTEADSSYLDYNATSPVKPAVIEAIAHALTVTGNPSSVHEFGRNARKLIEDARENVAVLAGAAPEDVIFTAGGTEANNLALHGAGRPVLMVSAIEHPSVLRTAETLAETLVVLPVDEHGLLKREAFADALAEHGERALVSIMLANNETGVVQPIAALAEQAKAKGALVHCDAVQGPGRIPVDLPALGVDMISISAHKFGGPKGVGALVLADDLDLKPLVHGGGQERGRRGGTENMAGIAGFGRAAALATDDLQNAPHIAAMRDGLERTLREIEPDLHVFSLGAERLPNTSCITMPGVQSETQVMGLDLAGAAISAGSACSSGKVEPSHVLRALGAPDDIAGCAIRVSLGWATTEADIDRFVEAWRALYAGLSHRWRAGVSAAANR